MRKIMEKKGIAKKLISLFAAAALVVPTVPFSAISAFAAEGDAASVTNSAASSAVNSTDGSSSTADILDMIDNEEAASEAQSDMETFSAIEDYLIGENENSSQEEADTSDDANADPSTDTHPLGCSIPLSAPNRIYADVSLFGAMVDENGNVVENCLNCFEESSEVIENASQQMVDEDAEATEAAEWIRENSPSQEEVDAQLLESLKEDNTPFDPALSDQSIEAATKAAKAAASQNKVFVGPTLITEGATNSLGINSDSAANPTITSQSQISAMATSVAHPDYSIEVTLKDITGFDNASSSDSSSADIEGSIYIGDASDGEYAKMRSNNIGIVRSYAFPTLSSRYFGFTEYPNPTNALYGDIALKMQLPVGQGEESEEFELMFGSRWPGGTARQEKNQWPTINDSTVLANFAKTAGYDSSRVIAYQNAYKLAPFASYEDIIKSGNAVPANHPLATKAISESWPIHKTDGMKLYLYEGDEENLVRYMVYFADGTHLVSDIEYLGTRHLAASYVDSSTGMLFQPDFWLIGEEGKAGIDFIANFIRSKTWSNYYNPVISKMNPLPDFNRIIKDHFDEKIHERAEEVAAELINYMDDWSAIAGNHQSWRGIINSSISKSPANNASSKSPEPIMFNLLFFYTYYDRLFGINIGGSEDVGYRKDANIFKIMAFKGSVIRPGLSLHTMTSQMNFAKMYGLSQTGRINIVVFPTCIGELTGISEAPTLVERAVRRTTDYADMNNWFADYMSTFCFYKEYKPSLADSNPDLDKLVWRGWDHMKLHPTDVLLWMTIQEPGAMYFMTTPISVRFGSTHVYSANVEFNDTWRNNFISKMDKTGYAEARYAATLTSICEAAQLNKISILGIDQVVSKLDGGASWLESEKLWGKTLTVDPFHKGYTDPMLRCQRSSQGAAIMSMNVSLEAKFIYYFMGQLSANWEYYQSHEIAHAIDNDVFLRGDRRAGTEDYTDGLLTQSYGSQVYIMNLSQDLAMTSDASANFTRERISTKEKLNDFYSKMYEAYDTLDYAMLKAFLQLDKDEQNMMAMQLQYSGRDGSSQPDIGADAVTFIPRNTVLKNYDGTDATTPVTSSQFVDGTRKFETREEVYDNQIVLFPGATGSFGWQHSLYVSTSLSGVYWHPIHANNTYADSRSFKVQMYRMLGREGYDAFANFGRLGGGQDLAKLKAITGYDSFRDWQLARWDKIEANKDSLAYVDFDELVDKFVTAMRTDAAGGDHKLTQMTSLRWRTYYMMKRVTNDFRYGLHTDKAAPITYIRTAADLQAISKNPYGNYVLANDIDLSNVTPAKATSYLAGTFYGRLDGKGYKLINTAGPLLPLFEATKHAYVKDIHLEGATSSSMATTVTNSEFEHITFTMFERNILTANDMAGIGADLTAGVRTFHFKNDIDMGAWSAANAAAETPVKTVVATMAKGTYNAPVVFNGNGHVIRNLSGASLFDKMVYSKLHDLEFENCSNMQDASSVDCATIIANHTHECDFEDLYFNQVQVSGRYRVAFVAGDDGFIGPAGNSNKIAGSRFKRIQVNNGSVNNGSSSTTGSACYAGFIAGRVYNSDLEDISVRGTLTTYGMSCGGLVGAITGCARINRCISNVDFAVGYSGNNGVMIGDIESSGFEIERTSILNSVALGNPGGASVGRFAKFAATNAKAAFKNCYETSDQKNGTSLGFDEQADVKFVRTMYKPGIRVWNDSWKREEVPSNYYTYPYLLDNNQFYEDLGYDPSLWDYSKTIAKGYPVLRAMANESVTNEYDLNAYVDYFDESIRLSGSDLDFQKTKIANIYFRILEDSSTLKKGDWWSVTNATSLSLVTPDVDRIAMGEAIDLQRYHDNFADMQYNGYWTVVISMSKTDTGKSHDFEKLIRVYPRPEMTYADMLVGIRADSKGNGSIRLLSADANDTLNKLEYRLKPADDVSASSVGAGGAAGAGASLSASAAAGWTPITSATTTVSPGTYEVRLSATDHSFASKPTTVTVDEYDPDAVTFPLVLDTHGGIWAEGFDAPTTYNNEETVALPAASTLSRIGYTFNGWYTNDNCAGNPVTQILPGQTNAVILHAGWTACDYSVALNLNGGSITNPLTNITKYTYGQTKTLPTPVRNGRIFAGWYDNEACEGEPVDAITSSDYGNKQFWAKWVAETYDVVLEPNGGTLVDGSTIFTYERGSGMLLPAASAISRDGFTFVGWYNNSNLVGNPVSAIAASDFGTKQFWAKWTPVTYQVVMFENGGRFSPGTSAIENYAFGSEVTLPTLEREGYTFLGWFDNASFAGDPIASIKPTESGNKTFWAKWEGITYNVSYVMGSDSQGNRPTIDAAELVPYEQYVSGSTFQLPDSSKLTWAGHTFAGWFDNEDLQGSPITEIHAGDFGDRTFYAKWVSENAYIVSYYMNGGSFETFPQTVFEDGVDGFTQGATIELPSVTNITKNGYTFEGWYASPAFDGSALTSVVLSDRNSAFYAKWRAKDYSIGYTLNGGSWATGFTAPVKYTIESGDLLLPGATDIVREGYGFNGWHKNANLLDSVTRVIPSGSYGDVDLFAAWQDNQGSGSDNPGSEATFEINLLQFDDVTFGSGASSENTISWDETTGYGKIKLLRSKMPQTASDFNIQVPSGIYVHSIEKRIPQALHMLSRVLALTDVDGAGAAGAPGAGVAGASKRANEQISALAADSDIWDIELRKVADPTQHKIYTLEIEPIDDEGNNPVTPPGDNGDDPSDDPSDNPPDNPVNPPNSTPGSGSGSGDGSGGSGSGTGGGGTGGTNRNINNQGSDSGNRLPSTDDDANVWMLIALLVGAEAAAFVTATALVRRQSRHARHKR